MENTRKEETGLKPTDLDPGFVYVITNPAWPGWSKIGKAKHPHRRLSGYQTYTPNRDFVLEGYAFDGLHSHLELLTHRAFADLRGSGEWFQVEPGEVLRFLETYAQVTECRRSIASTDLPPT